MASPLSEKQRLLGGLERSARCGDWKNALALAQSLSQSTSNPPETPPAPAELELYLDRLRRSLQVAKASRSMLIAMRGRVRAAAAFGSAGTETSTPKRYKFGVSAKF